MHNLLKFFLAIIVCSALAAWIRMFEPSMFIRPWSELIHAPLPELLGSIIGAPLFELLSFFPAYILASTVYFSLITLLKRRPSPLLSVAIGIIGALIVFLALTLITQTWIMRGVPYTSAMLFMYSIVGAAFGAICHRLGLDIPVYKSKVA